MFMVTCGKTELVSRASNYQGEEGYEDKSKKGRTWVKIYGDGRLLYTSPEFTGGVEPVDFEVDLTGVLRLKIERGFEKGFNEYDPSVYIVNTGLYQ